MGISKNRSVITINQAVSIKIQKPDITGADIGATGIVCNIRITIDFLLILIESVCFPTIECSNRMSLKCSGQLLIRPSIGSGAEEVIVQISHFILNKGGITPDTEIHFTKLIIISHLDFKTLVFNLPNIGIGYGCRSQGTQGRWSEQNIL